MNQPKYTHLMNRNPGPSDWELPILALLVIAGLGGFVLAVIMMVVG